MFKDQGGDFHPVATAQTYDGARLVLRALDKVGPDPQKIRDALEEIDDFTEAVTKMKPHPFSARTTSRSVATPASWRSGMTASSSTPSSGPRTMTDATERSHLSSVIADG